MKKILLVLVTALTLILTANQWIPAAELTGTINFSLTLTRSRPATQSNAQTLMDVDLGGKLIILMCNGSVEVGGSVPAPDDPYKTVTIFNICAVRATIGAGETVTISAKIASSNLYGPDGSKIDVDVYGVKCAGQETWSSSCDVSNITLSQAVPIELRLQLNDVKGIKDAGTYTGTVEYTVTAY